MGVQMSAHTQEAKFRDLQQHEDDEDDVNRH